MLYVSDWKTSYLTSTIAMQIINQNILQDDHRSATLNYDISSDRDAVLAFIDDTVPNAAAALEIWPGAFAEEADDDHFDHLGEVGLVALVGWYVPGYFVEQHPEATSWEFYTKNATADLLATEETSPLGRFLGMDSGYGDNIITEQNIKNHGMPLKQVYAGGDAASIEILANATDAEEPILLYWWNPRDNTAKYDLKRVELPPVTDACRSTYSSNDGKYNCDFIPEHAVKIATFGLKDSAPSVYAFLQQYELTNEDYENMLAQIDAGDDVESVSAKWVADNEAVWMAMLESTVDDKPPSDYVTSIGTGTPDEDTPASAPDEDTPVGDSSGAILMPLGTTLAALLVTVVAIFT